MGFITTGTKTTFAARAAISNNQKITATEYNDLIAQFNSNYQEFLDLQSQVAGLPISLPYVIKDTDFNITSKGIYLFHGATARTFTIDNAIVGDVIIRTIATAQLNLVGSISSGHMKVIYEGSAITAFLWDATNLEYTF